MDGHTCLLEFDTDSVQFARGFELGKLWAELRADPDTEATAYVHAHSAEMLLRIAEATGRIATSEELGDGWLLVHFDEAKDDE